MNDQDHTPVKNDSSESTSGIGSGLDIASLLRAFSSATPSASPTATEAETPQAATPKTTDGGDLLSSLLSNPQLLAALPTVISTVKPLLEGMNAPTPSTQKAASEPVPASTPQNVKSDGGSRDRHSALLCAIKPYLGQSRQSAVDYIMKLSRLGEVLKNL